MKKLQALLIGQSSELIIAALSLLSRSGFEIDLVITVDKNIKTNLLRTVNYVNSINSLIQFLEKIVSKIDYDLIVVCDDATLFDISNSNLSKELKIKFLPITKLCKAWHLNSKINLSKLLQNFGICTPTFNVASNLTELIRYAEIVGYPLMIKIDRSCGGGGVFKCDCIDDISSFKTNFAYPLLIQKWIKGDILDLSAFYKDAELVHFTYSKFEKVAGGAFGPSSVRRYWQLSSVDEAIFNELRALGKALGADGFVNITAIDSVYDSKRYYFEADMRPNVWVGSGKYIGNDFAEAINKFFLYGEKTVYPQQLKISYPKTKEVPYYQRLSIIEIILNRYDCWMYISEDINPITYLFAKAINEFIIFGCKTVKPYFPRIIWSKAGYLYYKYINSWVNEVISY